MMVFISHIYIIFIWQQLVTGCSARNWLTGHGKYYYTYEGSVTNADLSSTVAYSVDWRVVTVCSEIRDLIFNTF